MEKTVRLWAGMLKTSRDFFENRGFLEVTTRSLVPAGAFESSIDTLKVPGHGELHSSPEIAMKALMADVPLPMFQIARCFRDDPASPIHRTEFTMLEFYELRTSFDALVETTQTYFEAILGKNLPWNTVSVPALFQNLDVSLDSDLETFRRQAQRVGVESSIDDTWSDVFFRVMLEKIEPSLALEAFTIVTDYPAEVSPLSGFRAGTTFAERFEIYHQGMELCNGCTEQTDADALLARWEAESTARAARGAAPHPFPHLLIEAARRGLPPSAGTAVGLDRLFLVALRRNHGYQATQLVEMR